MDKILAIYSFFLIAFFMVSISLFVLNGIGIKKISSKLGLNKVWFAFVPFLNTFALGRIAEKYQTCDKKRSAKYSVILLVFCILQWVFLIIFFALMVLTIISIMQNEALWDITSNVFEKIGLGTNAIPSYLFFAYIAYIVALASAICYKVFYFIALWRIFNIFSAKNATLFLVLSIFISVMAPIFIFALRNNEPKLTFEERMGMEQIPQEING